MLSGIGIVMLSQHELGHLKGSASFDTFIVHGLG